MQSQSFWDYVLLIKTPWLLFTFTFINISSDEMISCKEQNKFLLYKSVKRNSCKFEKFTNV